MCPWNVFTLCSVGFYWICQNVLWSVISYSDWVTKSAWELWTWQLTRTNGSNGLGPVSGQKSEKQQKEKKQKTTTKEKHNNIITTTGDGKEKNGFASVRLLYYYYYYYCKYHFFRLSNDTTYMAIQWCINILFFRPDVWRVYNIIRKYKSACLYTYARQRYIYKYKI